MYVYVCVCSVRVAREGKAKNVSHTACGGGGHVRMVAAARAVVYSCGETVVGRTKINIYSNIHAPIGGQQVDFCTI